MKFNIRHLLHSCFYKLIIFIILLFITHFHKIEFTVIKMPHSSYPTYTGVSCHTVQFNIHRLLQACFYKFIIFIIFLFITHFHKIEFTVIKMCISWSCKYVCLVHKIIIRMRKKLIITSIHMSFYSLVSNDSSVKFSWGSTTLISEQNLSLALIPS
jgi:hypothetical protein